MMTRKEIVRMIERNMNNNPNPMIDYETAMKALRSISKHADRKNIPWALIGGVAMAFYGSPRLTKDVDVIAAGILPIEAERKLNFGGERYRAKVWKKTVPVDWIVRSDNVDVFYQKALAEAHTLHDGPPLVTPEWLVILKYIAGRFRDQQDAIFLLKKKGLVDRKLIRRKVTETIGPAGWGVFAVGLKRWYDLADGKITTEKEDYEADRL
jgi:hypothetical protein